jgi:hypothetical protein
LLLGNKFLLYWVVYHFYKNLKVLEMYKIEGIFLLNKEVNFLLIPNYRLQYLNQFLNTNKCHLIDRIVHNMQGHNHKPIVYVFCKLHFFDYSQNLGKTQNHKMSENQILLDFFVITTFAILVPFVLCH